jgi:Tfp pilus assembly major pilin PilA
MRRGQQGLTLIGFIVVLVLVGCLAYLAMRLIPMYTEYFSVISAIKGVAQEPGVNTMDEGRIRNLLGRRFNISYIESIEPKDVRIIRNTEGMSLKVDYEVRKPVVYNIDLIGHFEKTVPVGSTGANAP